jgi:hypothetical protein
LNLLDENFPADQAALLREWRIPHRQIGRDIADYGIHDTNIIPLLHRLKKATLFTQDKDFFKQNLCHSAYCLAWIDGKPGEAALYLRRFLRHRQFATQAKRMGVVARVSRDGIHFWRLSQTRSQYVPWAR